MTTNVSPKTFKEWIKTQYDNLPEDRAQAIPAMILTFTQTYEMLAGWMIEGQQGKLNYNVYNHKSYERACAAIWYDFCMFYNVGKGAVKVIFATQMAELKSELDDFANRHNIARFDQWIDNVQELSLTIDSDAVLSTDRPFFSLVVACYNDGRYAEGKYLDRLLESVCAQELSYNDIEVILSDDCSPVPYDEIVEKFKDKLHIVRTKTDHNFAPGPTRQKGVDIATGQWLCFADHDDVFYLNALSSVRDFIEERNELYYVFSAFDSVDPNGSFIHRYERTSGWCHGKFYNLDNLWKGQNINFIPDLASHEDIAICTQVACALDRLHQDVIDKYLDVATYAWTDNPESITHARYHLKDDNGTPRLFLEVYYEDYLRSTGYIYIEHFKNNLTSREYAMIRCTEVLCYAYLYIQGFQTYREDYSQSTLVAAGRFLDVFKKTFGVKSNKDVYKCIAANDGMLYMRIEPLARISAHYVPHQGVEQWINMVDRAYKKSLKN